MLTDKSMLECAFEAIGENDGEMSFFDIFEAVSKRLEMTDEEKEALIGSLYTNLTLDGRFVALTDNHWDLRSRHTYDKVHIDVNDVYTDVDETEADEEDVREEKKYNAEIEGRVLSDDEEETEDGEEGEKPLSEDVVSLVG